MKEDHRCRAEALFADLNVKIVLADRFLGGYIGDRDVKRQLFCGKIEKWIDAVESLSRAAVNYPQAAHAAFTHSLSMEWTHLQGVLGDLDEEFEPLKAAIRREFSPAVLGREILEYEHELFTLPAKKGGLAI